VKNWLVEHGMIASRLETEGFGPDEPIADNKSKSGRAKNRRIEFEILQ
jgi:outer membrane protein OmpA-like peptidoglycan-associated protein